MRPKCHIYPISNFVQNDVTSSGSAKCTFVQLGEDSQQVSPLVDRLQSSVEHVYVGTGYRCLPTPNVSGSNL